MEYSLDNGQTWTPVNTTTETFYYHDGSNDFGDPMEITYTYWVHSSSTLDKVNESFHLDKIDVGTKLLIRSVVAEDYRASKNGSIATNGSHRLGGNIVISFTPDAQ